MENFELKTVRLIKNWEKKILFFFNIAMTDADKKWTTVYVRERSNIVE